jgi:DNA-binding cell septation regulator SpoVG
MSGEPEIEIIELHLLPGDGVLRAFVSVRLDHLVTHEWRILKKNGQPVQVVPPMASWRDRDGVIRYKALLSLPPELKQRVSVAILSRWEKEKNGPAKE